MRLPREISHRRLVSALARRVLRVSSLHLLDAGVIAALAYGLSSLGGAFEPLWSFVAALIVVHLLSLNAFSVYGAGEGRRDRQRLLRAVVFAQLALFALTLYPPHLPLDAMVAAVLAVSTFGALAAGRTAVDKVVRHAYKRGIGLRRALLIGSLDEVGRAIEKLRGDDNVDQYIVGHLTESVSTDPTALGTIEDLPRFIEDENVQEVIVCSHLRQEVLADVADRCFERGAALFIHPPLPSSLEYHAEPLRVGRCTLLRLHPARLELPALLVKRIFDLVLATVAVIVFAPLMLLIAVAIKFDSRGPVFFRQERIGLGGRTFVIWKFRSMTLDSEVRQHELVPLSAYGDRRLFKIANDPRVTRVGRILRRTSLDELPQLYNVLVGEMSLVGPRPPVRSEVERYEPHHFERLTVIPGITGPWQVGGRNLITDFEKVVRMERAYIQSWSLWLDAKILLRTIKVVINGEGAY